jgi:acetate kinase
MNMADKCVVINCGSSSIKLEVFTVPALESIAEGLLEKIGTPDSRLCQRRFEADGSVREDVHSRPVADHQAGFDFILEVNAPDRIIGDATEVAVIGHRVVHGGDLFAAPTLIDDSVVTAIRELTPLAPLHNPSNLLGIEAARRRFPQAPHVAVFDTAFHQTLPPHAYRYALPGELCERHRVRRYGFHGSSHAYVARKAADHLGLASEAVNLITLHLGNGASAAAIAGGRSIDTSMGLTPLEGLVMGTRCGDLDPALHFYLLRQTGMSPADLEKLLNSSSGLTGLCGIADMREIQARATAGDSQAALALEIFCYRVKKYIGAYAAALGQVDAVVFTGGIGENSALVRQKICANLDNLGIVLDEAENGHCAGTEALISREGSRVAILVVPTDEESEIARQAMAVVETACRAGAQ